MEETFVRSFQKRGLACAKTQSKREPSGLKKLE